MIIRKLKLLPASEYGNHFLAGFCPDYLRIQFLIVFFGDSGLRIENAQIYVRITDRKENLHVVRKSNVQGVGDRFQHCVLATQQEVVYCSLKFKCVTVIHRSPPIYGFIIICFVPAMGAKLN